MRSWFLLFILGVLRTGGFAQKSPLPSPAQLAWHREEFYLFMHFGPNTFTDKEWGEGTEAEDLFNPTNLDTRQWCRIAKAAGAKGIIITAKHHDGFCLWPSKYSTHTVRESKWKNGKGDVLKELSKACKEYGLKFGVYLSPWDRNHPKYGTDEYNDVFVDMMKEIFSAYGPIWEFWWDGANGEGPNGKTQVYDWARFENTVKQLSPNTVVFSDIGPHIRWVGNEKGIAGETNWNFLDTAGFKRGLGAPHTDTLNSGNYHGAHWIPAECDVSIRPGWFYHKEEDGKVKSGKELFDLYLKSVGRGANLLLNVPPDRRGRIHANDSAALMDFLKLRKKGIDKSVADKRKTEFMITYFSPDGVSMTDSNGTLELRDYKNNFVGIDFDKPVEINAIMLQEDIQRGQRVRKFTVEISDENNKSVFVEGTSIGAKRILTFPKIKAQSAIIHITEADTDPVLLPFRFYLLDGLNH